MFRQSFIFWAISVSWPWWQKSPSVLNPLKTEGMLRKFQKVIFTQKDIKNIWKLVSIPFKWVPMLWVFNRVVKLPIFFCVLILVTKVDHRPWRVKEINWIDQPNGPLFTDSKIHLIAKNKSKCFYPLRYCVNTPVMTECIHTAPNRKTNLESATNIRIHMFWLNTAKCHPRVNPMSPSRHNTKLIETDLTNKPWIG
jgi:hypothetical protein